MNLLHLAILYIGTILEWLFQPIACALHAGLLWLMDLGDD